jgi:BCD family chlorophyll transporter-like MFS transporter
MFLKRIQLGMIHMAVAMTLVPITSTLNRVMIHELVILPTLVGILASVPYLFSPLQVAIGTYSDRHPIFGLRRTPYILLGLLLCVAGLAVSPEVAFLIAKNPPLGLFFAALSFGAWGMGYNLSSVSYLSLASELSGKNGRGKTVAIMWFMMIVSVIITAINVGKMVDPYTPQALQKAFWVISALALAIGLIGLIRLESRFRDETLIPSENYTLKEMLAAILKSRQMTLFFWYLTLLLIALLGQDILLEPFAAERFGMTVKQTTVITSIWGTAVLATILIAGVLEQRVPRKLVAQIGNIGALGGFLLIVLSGFTASQAVFYSGAVLLGAGTGLSTVANLALMFELTIPGYMGLFIGAWGVANALSRLAANLMATIVHDVISSILQNTMTGYLVVFGLEALILAVAIVLLIKIDVSAFQQQVDIPSALERAALAD